MLDASQNSRLNELTQLIEKERDHEKFTQLIAELNALLDGQKTPDLKATKAEGDSRGPDAHPHSTDH